MARKENSFHQWFNDDSRSLTKTLNIPAAAIRKAGFNTKYPVYLQEASPNHIILTQDGSAEDIICMVNGWKQPNGTKAYRIGAQSRFAMNTDSVMIIPDADYKCIDIVGVDWF